MRIVSPPDKLTDTAVCLGNFDGLHIAHTALINKCMEYAKENGLSGGVLLFKDHSLSVIKNEKIKLLTPFDEKIDILEKMQVGFSYITGFDERFMKKTPEEFILYLKEFLGARAVFIGYDYTFGYKAAAGAADLLRLCKDEGIYVHIEPRIEVMGMSVKSSAIREAAEKGDIKKANSLLGRRYMIRGKIISGKQNGRKMGLPTANIKTAPDKLLPADGVYSGEAVFSDNKMKCLINIGKNPTFGDNIRTAEVHIPGFSGDIYGEDMAVFFDERIRGEIKFSSPDELKKQIAKDIMKLNGCVGNGS